MIDPALAERLSAELRRRDASRREALTRLHETFADELGPLPDEPPVELGDLSAEELARARELMARAYEEVVGQKQNPEGA